MRDKATCAARNADCRRDLDETYIRVHGQYLYRVIDRDGALVDVMLSEHRNLAAAKRFFRSAEAVTGVIPDRATTPILGQSGQGSAAACRIGQTRI